MEKLSYYEAMYQGNPYAYDEGHYEQSLSLGGNGTKYVPSLMEQYFSGLEGLKAAHPDRGHDPADRAGYLEDMRGLQDELGYYPEFDSRMESAYREQLGLFEGYYEQALQSRSPEELQQLRDELPEIAARYEQSCRDELGYHPYAQEQEQALEAGEGPTMDEVSELGESRGEYETLDPGPTMDEAAGLEQDAGEYETLGEGPTMSEVSELGESRGEYETLDLGPTMDEAAGLEQSAGEYESLNEGPSMESYSTASGEEYSSHSLSEAGGPSESTGESESESHGQSYGY